MVNSRSKGQRGEREVAAMLNGIAAAVAARLSCPAPVMSRNLVQTQNGGHDLVGIDWIAVEVKFYKETQQLDQWWAQAVRQGERVNAEPVLIWKNNGRKWRVRMYGRLTIEPGRRLKTPVDISYEAFALWFEKRLEVELRKEHGDAFAGAEGLFG